MRADLGSDQVSLEVGSPGLWGWVGVTEAGLPWVECAGHLERGDSLQDSRGWKETEVAKKAR